MSDTPPTAMQLFAAELVREVRPLLAQLVVADRLNELLTKYQVAAELRIAPKRVQALLDSGVIKTVQDTNLVSRRELERFTAGRKR